MRGARPGRGRFLEALARWPLPAALRLVRRLAVLVVGGTVLLVGFVLFFTPGPGLLVVPLGLSILALEFLWARRLLARLREVLDRRGADRPPRNGQKDRTAGPSVGGGVP